MKYPDNTSLLLSRLSACHSTLLSFVFVNGQIFPSHFPKKHNAFPTKAMKAGARCELKQLCCYVNPDFSVKMSDVSEYSEFDYPKKKEKKKARWSYDKMLID